MVRINKGNTKRLIACYAEEELIERLDKVIPKEWSRSQYLIWLIESNVKAIEAKQNEDSAYIRN